MTPDRATVIWLAFFAVVFVLAYLRGFWGWLYKALSEADGTPSSSRLIAFVVALVNVSGFAYQLVTLGPALNLEAWATFMGYSQAGGSLPYLFNQFRRGISERNGPAPAQPPAGGQA